MVFTKERGGFSIMEECPPTVEIPGISAPVTVTSVGQVDELLEFMCNKQPENKKCGAYKQWKTAYNSLVYIGNRLAGFQRVKLIK